MIDLVLNKLLTTGAVAEHGARAWLYLGLWDHLDTDTTGNLIVARVVQGELATTLGRSRTRVCEDLGTLVELGWIVKQEPKPFDTTTRYLLGYRTTTKARVQLLAPLADRPLTRRTGL